MNKLGLLTFRWDGISPLHSGYSSEFAKFVKEYVKRRKVSVNLETRDEEGELQDAFLASSVKGVFRSASAWLVEKVARDALHESQFVTCDYWGDDAPQDKKMGCPVCQVYGGSGCCVGNLYRERAKATFAFDTDDALHPQTRVRQYNFAHEQISGKLGKKLEVESLQVGDSAFLHVRLDPADDLAVALVCLAADLISSGFFRFGRFTSRGYGVVRLIPHEHFHGNLSDLLAADDVHYEPSGVDSGYELAGKLLGQDPLEVVRRAVEEYVGSEK
jgi:hypothetical protein